MRSRLLGAGILCLCCNAFAATDFNGDGIADVLWRDASGRPVAWLMNGANAPDIRPVLSPRENNSWIVVGTGSFDGGSDGQFLMESSWGGYGALFTMHAGQYAWECNVPSPTPSAGSTLIGVGDVDGDGKSDVVWLDGTSHGYVWLMKGCGYPTTLSLGAAVGTNSYAVGDFDGDGKADLLLGNSSSGSYMLWLLNGNGTRSTLALAPFPPGWQLVRAVDFDGDDNAEILWRLPNGALRWSKLNLVNGTHIESGLGPQDPDIIFGAGFEDSLPETGPLSPAWKIVDVGDFVGNGAHDILFAGPDGSTQLWLMSGPAGAVCFANVPCTSVQKLVNFAATPDMPYPGTTGWALPLDRPTVTKIDGQVTVAWTPIANVSNYVLSASAQHDPSTTGTPIPVSGQSFSYLSSNATYSSDRYFSASAAIWGVPLPPSPEAYLVDFTTTYLPYLGPLAVFDINNDGCLDLLGAYGDCAGGFAVFTEGSVGLGALRANGRLWRDLRFADFNGDGIADVIANVYSCDSPACGGNDTNSRIQLYWGNGDGTFTQDIAFDAMNIPGGGNGETIVLADFDNDGSLDIFLPKYTAYDPAEHNFLLINDGHGNFTDMADSAGVAMRETPISFRPEGAEAVDIDNDGLIDLYAGSHLFINQTQTAGNPRFLDLNTVQPLPWYPWFDEGAKFIDWNNDGNLDLVLMSTYLGPKVWQNSGYEFQYVDVMPNNVTWNWASGMDATDIDGDGREDLVVAGGCDSNAVQPPGLSDVYCQFEGAAHQKTHLLLNRGSSFVASDFYDDGITDDTQRAFSTLQTFADFDNSGTMDVVSALPVTGLNEHTNDGSMLVLMNKATSDRVLHVTVLGPNGEHNQFGRVVRVQPQAKSAFVMTQVVDGGSGYLGNSPYTLQFATPWAGTYNINVRLASGVVQLTADVGANVMVYADGRVVGAAAGAASMSKVAAGQKVPVNP